MIQTRRSIAGLLLGVLVSGSPVLAAGGPYFTNLRRGLFYPAYLPRDTPAIAAALGLTDQEEILVETIIDRYVAQYQQEAEAVQLELETATGGRAAQLEDLAQRREIRRLAAEAMRPQGNPGYLKGLSDTGADRRARVFSIIGQELELESPTPADPSDRSVVIQDWGQRRLELESQLVDQFRLIQGVDAGRWEAVERAIRRLNSSWQEQFRGEESDLDYLLRLHFGVEDSRYQALRASLMEYAEAYDRALQQRNAILATTTPALLDAMDQTNLSVQIALLREQIAARQAVVALNGAWLERFLGELTAEDAKDFRAFAYRKMFPDVHRGDPPADSIDFVLADRSLDPETAAALEELKQRYREERDAWRLVAVAIMPAWEADRLRHELETNAVATAYPGWLNGLGDVPPSLRDWKRHLDLGLEMDREYLRQLRDLVGTETYDTIPSRYRVQRRGDPRRGPVPESSKQPMNVVYWDEVMKSQKDDQAGVTADEE